MCLFPKLIYNKSAHAWINASCNHCIECEQKYRTSWQFRLQQELKRAKSTFFVTLTYDDENLPSLSNGEVCYDNQHFTAWRKRMATYFKRHNDANIKYICTGEFGDETQRPHYHLILFIDCVVSYDEVNNAAHYYWDYAQVVDVDEPRSNNAVSSYVTKYVMKDYYRETKPIIEGSKTNKFRIHVSNNLGLNWLGTQESKEFYFDPDNHPLVSLKGDDYSRTIPIPRYYRKKIGREYTSDELNLIAKNVEKKQTDDWINAYNEYTTQNGYISITDWFINVYDKRDERRREIIKKYSLLVRKY